VGVCCIGSLPKRTFGIDNQFAIQAMFDAWAGSDGAVTFSFGGLAIIRRATCMFMMMTLIHYANEFENDATDGCGQGR
jgi:F0F1-type ATP synthase assembly protein I